MREKASFAVIDWIAFELRSFSIKCFHSEWFSWVSSVVPDEHWTIAASQHESMWPMTLHTRNRFLLTFKRFPSRPKSLISKSSSNLRWNFPNCIFLFLSFPSPTIFDTKAHISRESRKRKTKPRAFWPRKMLLIFSYDFIGQSFSFSLARHEEEMRHISWHRKEKRLKKRLSDGFVCAFCMSHERRRLLPHNR